MKKMLILSANADELPFICLARSMGFYVITTDNIPSQIGHKYADKYVPFDYSDYEGITQMAKKEGIDAVFEGCSDNCALTAAYISEKLHLKGHDSFAVTEIIHHKDKFKQFCKENNIQSPASNIYDNADEAISIADKLQYPVIVKPNDMAGGQGVSIARNKTEYLVSINVAFNRSRSKNIVVEPFLKGTLHSLHCFLVDQKVVAYATANDYSYLNRFMTSYGLFPADNHGSVQANLIPEIERIAKILHLVDGQIDTQYIDCHGKLWIIEMMRRCPGNHTTEVLANSIGINWREWILRAVAGESVSNIPETRLSKKFYGYYCIMGNKNGIVKKINIDDSVRKFIYQYYEYERPGFEITDYLSKKLGLVEFSFDNETEKNQFINILPQLITVEYI